MIKYQFIAFVLLFSSASYSQSKRDNFKIYYSLVNQAELSIVDSNFDEANKHYKKAFKYKTGNDKDIFNAEIVSYLVGDTAFALENLNRLAYYGMKKMVFEGSTWGTSVTSDSFYLYISKNYDSIYQKRETSPMAKYGKQLYKFYQKDQSVRGRQAKIAKADVIKSDHENILDLKAFIERNGFPGFQRAGFFDEGGFSIQMFGTFYLVLWHSRPLKTPLDKIMYNAVLDGEFRPDKYAYILDHRNGQENNKYCMVFQDQVLSREKEDVIDREREKIYLEKLADFRKKFYFSIKDKRFELIHPTVFGENMLIIKLQQEEQNKKNDTQN